MPIDLEDLEKARSYIGAPTGNSVITIERQPVSNFAKAVKDTSPIYHDPHAARAAGFDDIPAPPTWAFAMGSWGTYAEDQPAETVKSPLMDIIGTLMQSGGMVLHGEQEFGYHKPLVVGMRLAQEGRVADVYQKESGDRVMTFVVTENEYRDETGDLVMTARMNLLHRS